MTWTELNHTKGAVAFFKRKAQGHHCTYAELMNRWLQQSGLCALCLAPLELDSKKTHLDHIVPKAQGGIDTIHNLELVCCTCNYAKRDTSLVDFVLLCTRVENTFHNTDILPKESVNCIVRRRWRREQLGNHRLAHFHKAALGRETVKDTA
jgi:hypothetical protein